MLRGNPKKFTAFSLALLIGLSSTAIAKAASASEGAKAPTKTEAQKMNRGEHRKEEFNKLLNQLGLSKEDLDKARASNKTLFDLAKEKGYTPEQVREIMIKNKTESINKAVSEGKLTQEKADIILKGMKEKLSNWDGSFNKGHKGFLPLKELGLTEEDIAEARKSGKTIFDLAKEKKGLSPQQVKDIMIKSKTERINKKVSEGKLPKEKADEILSNMKSKIQNWDGTIR
jgi:lipoate-protein ligase A